MNIFPSDAATKAVVDSTATTVATINTNVSSSLALDTTISDVGEKCVIKAAATMTNNQTMFTIAGGPIMIVELLSECITTNDGTASTLQYRSNPTVGSAATISGASASLASVAAGATVRLAPTALSTAPVVALAAAGGAQIGTNVANRITVQPGTIQMVIGVGSTTGTWKHFLRYQPLGTGVTVT